MNDYDDTDGRRTHRVALMGFTSFEQQALDSYIRLARERTPSYEPAGGLEDADFVVANGDRSGIVDLLITSQRLSDTVLVGSLARQGSAAWLERPIDPLHLFRALDTAVRRRGLLADAARAPARSSARDLTPAGVVSEWPLEALNRWDPAASRATHPLSGMPLDASDAAGMTAADPSSRHALPLRPVPKRVPPGPGEPLLALVVDGDDEHAMRMAMALQAHGISSERASDSRSAFIALEDQVFDLILVDVALHPRSDLDGLSLTQALRRQPRPYGECCPPILVTSAAGSALEQAQALLAGATSYLSKPLEPAALSRALEEAELRVQTLPSQQDLERRA